MRIPRLLLSFVLLLPLQTFAEVYDVSTTAELREALASAAEAGGDNTIRLAAGTYSIQDDGEGPFKFSTQLQGSLIITSLGNGEVVLDGGGVNEVLRFNFPESKPFETLHLENLRLSNTPNDVGIPGDRTVGGLFVERTQQLILRNMFFDEHRYVAVNVRSITSLKIERSVFQSNDKALIAHRLGGTSVIDASTFSMNGNRQDVIQFGRNSDSTIKNSSFSLNTVTTYGSSLIRNVAVVTGNSFTNNFGDLIRGGSHFDRGDVLISRNTFEGNFCADDQRCGLSVGGTSVYVANNIILNTAGTAAFLPQIALSADEETIFSNNLMLNVDLGLSSVPSVASNNIFLGTATIAGGNDIININNNYLDEDGLDDVFYEGTGNIFEGVNLGFVNAQEGDYRLTSSSGLIDAGTTDPDRAYITDYDYTGTTARVIGDSIDIGPYEYDGEAPPDSDGDGLNDNIDNCPTVYNEDQADFDSDGEGDVCDTDDDNDGTNDEDDAFPFDDTESLDTDGDGIGNNEDYDDDADGILDSFDNAPLVVNTIVVDSDNDGVIDSVDAYPNDPTKQYSGSGDLDGDGYSNDEEVDYCSNPFDKNSQPDIGGLSLPMIHLLTEQ